MNRLADSSVQPNGCDCDNCRSGDLPSNPFLAPRVTHGMLLGEDDFATVIGYPRGKHQLHQAWLHGSGVVWGYPVRNAGLYELKVGPGLAIDGIGRELLLTAHRNPGSARAAGQSDQGRHPGEGRCRLPNNHYQRLRGSRIRGLPDCAGTDARRSLRREPDP